MSQTKPNSREELENKYDVVLEIQKILNQPASTREEAEQLLLEAGKTLDQHLTNQLEKAKKHGEAVGEYRAAERLYGDVTTMWLFHADERPKLRENVEEHANSMLKDCEAFMNDNAKEWQKHIKSLQSTTNKERDGE